MFWIFNPHQIQPSRRYGYTSLGSIAHSEYSIYPFWFLSSQPDCNQNPYNIANHVLKECVGYHIDIDAIPMTNDP
uniref:Uncharacterized protein n=1 Tax=Candidatus Kentrum sp. TC TaxID=2126339 RepID=A0A450YS77_9GAMM|nr:MAG: hypothetical protein BECKTC1821E_GA0114239_10341 [Candidatus Kentron sp. TC]